MRSCGADASAQQTTIIAVIVLLAAGLALAGVGLWIAHKVTKRLVDAARAAATVATGNVDLTMTSKSNDDRSSAATKEIEAIVAKVQEGTRQAGAAMAAGVKDVDSGRAIAAEAGNALSSIITTVEDSVSQVQMIASEVQSLAAGAQRIVKSAEEIASIAEQSATGAGEIAQGSAKVTEAIVEVSATSAQTSASAESVSASTEEVSAQSQELVATANNMRDLADALNVSASRFRLELGEAA